MHWNDNDSDSDDSAGELDPDTRQEHLEALDDVRMETGEEQNADVQEPEASEVENTNEQGVDVREAGEQEETENQEARGSAEGVDVEHETEESDMEEQNESDREEPDEPDGKSCEELEDIKETGGEKLRKSEDRPKNNTIIQYSLEGQIHKAIECCQHNPKVLGNGKVGSMFM